MVSAGPMIETANLQGYEKAIADGLASLARDRVVSRIWKKDWTVWGSSAFLQRHPYC